MLLTLDLPIAPSANALYCNVPGRGRAKTAAYKAWIKAARGELWTQKPTGGFPFFAGAFHVVVAVPLAMRGDVDNRNKASIDFLKRGACVIPDDNKTYSAMVTRDPAISAGRMRITISDEPIVVAV
jgi:hypothetical protein